MLMYKVFIAFYIFIIWIKIISVYNDCFSINIIGLLFTLQYGQKKRKQYIIIENIKQVIYLKRGSITGL